MIVPTMTSEELVREIMKDHPIVYRKGMYALEKLRRPALKSQNKHVQRIYDYESKNKNKWIIICDYYVKDPSWIVVVHFVDKWGIQAYMVDANQRTLTHYSGHFLERYNERFLHETELSKMEIFKRYLSKNSSAYVEWLPDTDEHQKPFFGRSREGIVLGNVESLGLYDIIHARTFIANDMIFESQKGKFDSTGEHYKQYWDEVYKKRNQDAFDN
jgi:hypothetical protein